MYEFGNAWSEKFTSSLWIWWKSGADAFSFYNQDIVYSEFIPRGSTINSCFLSSVNLNLKRYIFVYTISRHRNQCICKYFNWYVFVVGNVWFNSFRQFIVTQQILKIHISLNVQIYFTRASVYKLWFLMDIKCLIIDNSNNL